ncbi:DEAD/DEAH box helicase family protein [Microbacterium sp.]|uniref:type I restriction endonuclease subunit R n=1 Tax=Microbacterium sp. TaxID=51671 RepID=UPI0037CAACFF
MGNFDFALAQWPGLAEAAMRAESYLKPDPRTAATYARRAAELFTGWIYAAENLARPYDDSFSNLTHQRPFRDVVGDDVWGKLKIIRLIGNDAVHKDDEMPVARARSALEQLHQVLRWLHHCYGDPSDPEPAAFDFALVPPAPAVVLQRTRAQLQKLQSEFDEERALLSEQLAAARALGAQALADLDTARAELAELKAANQQRNAARGIPDPAAATEAATRTQLIDLLLREAGWPLDDPRDREYPVTGMPSATGAGKVDYVLWGDDGKPLAVVEAKRTRLSAKEGRLQGELYADALERAFGQRPLIYYTNGYRHWLWDDRRYPPREVAGFATKDELTLAVQRRTSLRPLDSIEIDRRIVERPYQLRAIRAVNEAFEQKRRRALVVMATGTGKTRTVIALVDVLQRANWVKRVLFLADRTALVNQAIGAFKAHLPDSAPVNLLTDRDSEGRVFVSTYQTVMGLIDAGDDDLRRFGPGYFDLIVVDEAHRSIYHRYGEIFDYFDALVVGLTATPRADIDRNTYRLFGLDDGVPTDAFELDDAIEGGYLVPPRARVIDLGFMKRGIRYADLTDAEREEWDALEWQDGEIPDEIDAAAMNRWLFNADTVDKVLEILFEEGHRVAGGDRLGKTIVFAKNQRHADFIEERIYASHPENRGQLARVITHAAGAYAQKLIDDFSTPGKPPDIAISVDMLDTGIDIPDVVNLVFFKPVHSQTKYWQMIGRGTRLRPDLYGPGQDKTDFLVFDVCGNIEYFNADVPEASTRRQVSLSERTFLSRLRLLALLAGAEDTGEQELRDAIATRLHRAVTSMNRGNVIVRKHLEAVDRFSGEEAWRSFSAADLDAAAELAGLPSPAETDADEAAKRFDDLILQAQIAVAEGAVVPPEIIQRGIDIAQALTDRRGIPAVDAQRTLIDAISQPEWWRAPSLTLLERVRIALRELVRLIDQSGRRPLFTDFEDSVDLSRDVEIDRIVPGLNRRAFREKVLGFLHAHSEDVALHKLRTGRALTDLDLQQLEEILVSAGGVDASQLRSRSVEAGGLGRFIRSIVGLDRSAAEAALSDFVAAPGFTQRQHAFIDLVVQQLTIAGELDPKRLYEDPFTGLSPEGPDGLFTDAQVTDLIARLRGIDATAEPAPEADAV